MKRILTLALACAALPVLAQAPEAKTDTAKGFRFTDIKTVKTGSVKDQNKSGTCWAFSGTSFVEDEIMRKGGPELDLSEMFTVRHCYDDKADKYMRMDGTINFAQGGGLWDIMYVLGNYGLVPEEAYAGLEYGAKKHEHYELADGLTGYLKGVMRSKKRSTAWKQGFDGILDAYLGKLPESFTYNGRKYTPPHIRRPVRHPPGGLHLRHQLHAPPLLPQLPPGSGRQLAVGALPERAHGGDEGHRGQRP